MMMNALVLEWKGGEGCDEQNVQVVLPNVPGQRYVFGSKYPGDEREGEEFIFIRNERILVDPTHFVISFDEQGQYWMQSETTKFKTFVNSERLLLEPRLLKIGDVVLLEGSKIRCGYPNRRHLIFYIEERIVPCSGQETEGAGNDSDIEGDGEVCKVIEKLDLHDAESPLDNTLILEKIMSYLPVSDLKNARQVSKKWKDEASKPLQKKGVVSFTFNDNYRNPDNSTRVIRYLHEMRDLKMKNLHISLLCSQHWYYQRSFFSSPGGPGQKAMDDLRKLLNSSHNCSSLFLQADIKEKSHFLPCFLILQEVGEKLVELKVEIQGLFLPATLPPFPVMNNLKQFTGEWNSFNSPFAEFEPRWASLLVPLFSNSLEHFTCSSCTAEAYLQELLKHPTPNLKRISLNGKASVQSLSSLLELESPLTFLEIQYCEGCTEEPEDEELLERLLLKNSKSLQHLVIRINNYYCHCYDKDSVVNFPSFQSLEELEVEYGPRTRIGWGYETSLDYEDHFPSLRKLTVRPREPWSEDDQVFNVFFRRRELRCETVQEVWIPVLQDLTFHCDSDRPYVPLESFQPKMDLIKKIFPKAGKINFFQ